jgi:hypothetical protein
VQAPGQSPPEQKAGLMVHDHQSHCGVFPNGPVIFPILFRPGGRAASLSVRV